MTDKQHTRWLQRQIRLDRRERKLLRKIGGLTASAIHDAAHGHSPNWQEIQNLLEKYEDNYSPFEDGD